MCKYKTQVSAATKVYYTVFPIIKNINLTMRNPDSEIVLKVLNLHVFAEGGERRFDIVISIYLHPHLTTVVSAEIYVNQKSIHPTGKSSYTHCHPMLIHAYTKNYQQSLHLTFSALLKNCCHRWTDYVRS